MSISGMFGGENLESMLRSEFYNVGSDSREDKLGAPFHRLPLFSRCPITNEARLENPGVSRVIFLRFAKFEILKLISS